MPYNTWFYLLPFLGTSLLIYYLLPPKFRWTVLLCASILFYMIASGLLILVVFGTSVVIWAAALRIEKHRKTFEEEKEKVQRNERKALKAVLARRNGRVIAAVCVIAFGILFFTKYFNFVGENLNALFGGIGLAARIPVLRLMMPLGISFYTLSAVSYVTDVSRERCDAEKNLLRLFLFLIFFPVVTEGPISRYQQLGAELKQEHRFDYQEFCFGAQLIIWGLVEKVVFADWLNRYVHEVFKYYSNYSGIVVILGMLLYTFQIYMDFDGCINIARGSAQMFGIRLTENFRQPFFAASAAEFWRRWHISLGAWLKDYVFYPISLSRFFQSLSKTCRKHFNRYYASAVPTAAALLGVWLGNGIWHGAEWKYIFYGIYYYIILFAGRMLEPLFEKAAARLRIDRAGKPWHLVQIARTFVIVNIGMLIFRAETLTAGFQMIASMFRPWDPGDYRSFFRWSKMECNYASATWIGIVIAVVLVFLVGFAHEKGVRIRERIAALPVAARWAVYIAAVLVVVIFGAYGPGFGEIDFIYAGF